MKRSFILVAALTLSTACTSPGLGGSGHSKADAGADATPSKDGGVRFEFGTLDAEAPVDASPFVPDGGQRDVSVDPPDGQPVDAAEPDAQRPDMAQPVRDAGPAPDVGFPPGTDECGDVRQANKVFFGTVRPTHVPLNDAQILAVGSFNGCTGTLIAASWVLTAAHCELEVGREFCVGADPQRPFQCLEARRVINHPQADQTLVELTMPLSTVAPGVEPIAVLRNQMQQNWVGRTAEAAGYGQTDTGDFNVRWFTAEPIVAVGDPFVSIDGQGERGVCFGDSGGPIFVIDLDGQVKVAGDLSHGDQSCVGQDNFTRADLTVDWIEGLTGPTGPGGEVQPLPCGPVDAIGYCDGEIATWCDGDLSREMCENCGWSDREGGFRCIRGADPCLGFDREGACDGQVARWCANGLARARDCGGCGVSCAVVDGVGATCVDDPCDSIDFLGQCNGDVAEWCDDQGFHEFDCGGQDMSCGYINDEIGFYCQ